MVTKRVVSQFFVHVTCCRLFDYKTESVNITVSTKIQTLTYFLLCEMRTRQTRKLCNINNIPVIYLMDEALLCLKSWQQCFNVYR